MNHISRRRIVFHVSAMMLLFILGQFVEARASAQNTQTLSADAAPPQTSTQDKVEILTPTQGVDFSLYIRKMARNLKKNWLAVMPKAAYTGAQGRTSVQFQVQRDGKIENITLKATAGNDELDQAALNAIRHSNPLDPLPTEFKGSYIELRYSFAMQAD